MVKVGFICEGQTEELIIKSEKFQQLILKSKLIFSGSRNSKSNGRLLPEHITKYNISLQRMGAWKIFILSDSDKKTVTQKVDEIKPNPDLHILIVAVKKIESWFLSNDEALVSVCGVSYSQYKETATKKLSDNVEELGSPYDVLKDMIAKYTKQRDLGKLDIAELFIERGFDLEKSNCDSARYFINRMKEVGERVEIKKTVEKIDANIKNKVSKNKKSKHK